MSVNIAPVENHREREKGVIVYPVYSRRSGGLSIGINLFPDRKSCQFDCPYCEVFPFSANAEFSPRLMESDLRGAIADAKSKNVKINDICFSGNGEPTLSPAFPDALERAEKIREETALCAKLVIITNGAGLISPEIFALLKKAACNPALDIWLKLDAGDPLWYKKINRCSLPYETLAEKIKEFIISAPVTIQTMLCAVNGEPPPDEEARTWENFLLKAADAAATGAAAERAANGGAIRKVQIYGKARPAPEDPLASALPAEILERRAASLRRAFADNSLTIPVEIYL